jgi:hypothetical protein
VPRSAGCCRCVMAQFAAAVAMSASLALIGALVLRLL